MTDADGDRAWFEAVDPGTLDGARQAIEHGSAEGPTDWPARAVEAGFADDEEGYYRRLHEATVSATREAIDAAEGAGDRQVVHAVRAMDDTEEAANGLAERALEWGGSLLDDVGTGLEGARELGDRDPDSATEARAVSLARRAVDLLEERDELRSFLERRTPEVAPNLAAMAGPVLAARLVSLAGSLEELAKLPSGTVQVLGAEEALFAHLRGHAPSPKHGVIYTHEYVHGTRPEDRGSAARAVAGKLAIAARIDHYSGERRPELQGELDQRIRTIRARGAEEADSGDADSVGEDGRPTDEREGERR